MKTFATVAALLAMGTAAQAASVTVQTFSFAEYNNQLTSNSVVEDFESFSTLSGSFANGDAFSGTNSGTLSGALGTNVGVFNTLGQTGSGTTCQSNNGGADCDTLALEFDDINGQGNVVPADGHYSLSSNDTLGISWLVGLAGGQEFTSAAFALRDAADVGARSLTVTVGGQSFSFGDFADGNEQLVVVNFGGRFDSAQIDLQTGVNDGFTYDGAVVAAVPLPASVLLMLGGLGALGATARRRAKKKAA